MVTSLLANSLWLRDGMTYSQQTLDTLAKVYFASSFRALCMNCVSTSPEGAWNVSVSVRSWLNSSLQAALK